MRHEVTHVPPRACPTDERARHPFRRSLPPHVCAVSDLPRPRSLLQAVAEDWRSVLGTYCATFVMVSLYIA
jgi:hypothetical protein